MKPAPFAYVKAASLDQVFDLLTRHGDEARVLAGGQSLIPTLNLRLSAPAVLIDITCAVALDAEIEVRGPAGPRSLGAPEFFRDLHETDLRPDELVTAVRVRQPAPGQRSALAEFARRHGDCAMIGLAASAESELGAKGAGEAGTGGAPGAIMNAINDALAPMGVVLTAQPATPERILRALGKVD